MPSRVNVITDVNVTQDARRTCRRWRWRTFWWLWVVFWSKTGADAREGLLLFEIQGPIQGRRPTYKKKRSVRKNPFSPSPKDNSMCKFRYAGALAWLTAGAEAMENGQAGTPPMGEPASASVYKWVCVQFGMVAAQIPVAARKIHAPPRLRRAACRGRLRCHCSRPSY